MVACLPQGICSSNYSIAMPSGDAAEVNFRYFSSQGSILSNGVEYTVERQGMINEKWMLQREGNIIARARKANFLSNTLLIDSENLSLTIKPASFFSSRWEARLDEAPVGWIEPVHMFTRRANMEWDPAIPELIQLFAFWVRAMLWRRQSQSAAAGAG